VTTIGIFLFVSISVYVSVGRQHQHVAKRAIGGGVRTAAAGRGGRLPDIRALLPCTGPCIN